MSKLNSVILVVVLCVIGFWTVGKLTDRSAAETQEAPTASLEKGAVGDVDRADPTTEAPNQVDASVSIAQQQFACDQPCVAEPYEQAESHAEALWLNRMGFPSIETRNRAKDLNANDLIDTGQREKSTALIALGMEKQIAEALPFEVELKLQGLSALASSSGALYPVIVEARARLDLYRREPEYGRATNQLEKAAIAMRLAAMLGDYKAMQLSEGIPLQEQSANFWANVEHRAALQLQRAEFIPAIRLRRSQSAARPFPKESVCEGVPAPYSC